MAHEFDGRKYEKVSAHQKEWGSRLIAELQLGSTERVLDLGCGDGTLTARIAEILSQGNVMGVDASRGMIEAALPKERNNLHFRRLDIDDLDFAGEFDVVFSNAALHWVKDHRKLLKNAHRALCRGGRIRFNFGGEGNCTHLFAVVREAMIRKEFRAHFVTFEWPWFMPSVAEYRKLMESSEFWSVQVWGENADRFFRNEEEMIGWIDQPCLVPFLTHIGNGPKEAFRDYVVERMVEKTKQEDGTCFETFRRINVLAVK